MLSWFGNRSADVKRGGERKDGNVAQWRPQHDQHDGFHYAKLHGDNRLVRAALAVSEFPGKALPRSKQVSWFQEITEWLLVSASDVEESALR